MLRLGGLKCGNPRALHCVNPGLLKLITKERERERERAVFLTLGNAGRDVERRVRARARVHGYALTAA